MPDFDTSKVTIIASLFLHDSLTDIKKVWYRPPIVTVSEVLKPGLNKLRSPFGGPLTIEVIGRDTNAKKPITAKVFGGTPMGMFTLGRTNESTWTQELKKEPSWIIVQGKHVASLEYKRTYANVSFQKMVAVAKRFDLLLQNYFLISGYDLNPNDPEDVHAAPQGTWWWVRDAAGPNPHAGNPVVAPGHDDNDITLSTLETWALWLFAHEFGHGMQTKCYSGTYGGEVTVNIYSAFAQSYFCGEGNHSLACKQDPKDFEAMQNLAVTEIAAGKKYLEMVHAENNGPALVFWLQLTATFGFEPIRKMHRRFREMIVDPNDTVCKGDTDVQFDAVFEILCEITDTDLTKHFKTYKVPITPTVYERVAAKKYAQPKVDLSYVKLPVGTPLTWKPFGPAPAYALPAFSKFQDAQ
jgi:hypothetical protein